MNQVTIKNIILHNIFPKLLAYYDVRVHWLFHCALYGLPCYGQFFKLYHDITPYRYLEGCCYTVYWHNTKQYWYDELPDPDFHDVYKFESESQ